MFLPDCGQTPGRDDAAVYPNEVVGKDKIFPFGELLSHKPGNDQQCVVFRLGKFGPDTRQHRPSNERDGNPAYGDRRQGPVLDLHTRNKTA